VAHTASHCKAIAKSTGKPCQRAPVKNGLCRYHLPWDQRRDDPPPDSDAPPKNLALGEAFRDQQHTTRQKNRFIRVIVVSTRRKKKKKSASA